MIEKYFGEIEKILQTFPLISTYTLTKKIYNRRQGYIRGSISLRNGHHLDFVEVKNVDIEGKLKYRYQYMDAERNPIFRYDNAPHHKNLQNFPHHKHTESDILTSSEPTLENILFEIAQENRK